MPKAIYAHIQPTTDSSITIPPSDKPVKDDVDLDIGKRVDDASENLIQKMGLKTAENVDIVGRRKSMRFVNALLASPSKIRNIVQYYAVHGKNAGHTQDRLRGMADEKMSDIFKPLKKSDLRKEFTALAFLGDIEEKVYTTAELNEMGVSPAVQEAYLKQRKFHEQVWRLLNAHRRVSILVFMESPCQRLRR